MSVLPWVVFRYASSGSVESSERSGKWNAAILMPPGCAARSCWSHWYSGDDVVQWASWSTWYLAQGDPHAPPVADPTLLSDQEASSA